MTIELDKEISIISPCEECNHAQICKYADSMKDVIESIKGLSFRDDFISDITFGCKHQTKESILSFPPGVRDIDIDAWAKSTSVSIDTKKPTTYKTNAVGMVPKYDPKEAITAGLEDHLNNSPVTTTNLGVTMEDGTSRSIASSSKTRKAKSNKMEPVMPTPIPESQADPVAVNAVLLTIPDGVPVESVNMEDVPVQYRASIMDNTVTEPTPGQTTNI